MVKDRYKYKLIFVGSCRNQEDIDRVNFLKQLVLKFGIKSNIEFVLNVFFEKFKFYFVEVIIGFYIMWNEYFGIGVVECMVSGVVVLVYDLGGLRMDIVIEWEGKLIGFLVSDEKSYFVVMEMIFVFLLEERSVICYNVRDSVNRFLEKVFENGFF